MDNDDAVVGYLFSRREALTILGASGLAWLGRGAGQVPGSQGGPCVVRPALTEGPFFVDERLNRSDIRSDPATGALSAGAMLTLAVTVSRIGDAACAPLAGAMVDLWQCDALGVYSDVEQAVGRKFLRGYQLTGADGKASFTTIYPGWYPGRAVHIHFKVRSPAGVSPGYEFTSQWFFDDSLTDQVLQQPPYVSKQGARQRNENDGIFRRGGGSQLVLDVARTAAGYSSRFDIALRV
jgi:protocatechuate 3,4-dioxygenase beta subunit